MTIPKDILTRLDTTKIHITPAEAAILEIHPDLRNTITRTKAWRAGTTWVQKRAHANTAFVDRVLRRKKT